MYKIKRLSWDSDFFRFEVGFVDLSRAKGLENFKFDPDFDLIYAFCDQQILVKSFPKYIDQKIVFKKQTITDSTYDNWNIEIYNNRDVTKELVELAIQSGHCSRFKLDDKLKPYFEQLYTLWLYKSLNRTIADQVLVCRVKSELVGLLTLKDKGEYVQIGLMSTSKKHWGKGIGSTLLSSISKLFPGKAIKVATQMDNKKACAFYTYNGYSIDSTTYIYHLWK